MTSNRPRAAAWLSPAWPPWAAAGRVRRPPRTLPELDNALEAPDATAPTGRPSDALFQFLNPVPSWAPGVSAQR